MAMSPAEKSRRRRNKVKRELATLAELRRQEADRMVGGGRDDRENEPPQRACAREINLLAGILEFLETVKPVLHGGEYVLKATRQQLAVIKEARALVAEHRA